MASSTNTIWCPSCHKRYRVPENGGGKTLRCKKCKFAFLISDALTVDPELAARPVAEIARPSRSDRASSAQNPSRDSAAAKEKLLENDFDDILDALDNPNSAPTQQPPVKAAPKKAVSKRNRNTNQQPAPERDWPTPSRTTTLTPRSRSRESEPTAQPILGSAYDKHQRSKRLWVRLAVLLSLLLGGASAFWLYSSPVPMLSKMEFSILKAIGIPPTWISDGANSESVAINNGEVEDGDVGATIRLKPDFAHLAQKPPRETASNEPGDKVAGTPFAPGEKEEDKPNVDDQANRLANNARPRPGQQPDPNAPGQPVMRGQRPDGGAGGMRRGDGGAMVGKARPPRPRPADVNGRGGPQLLGREDDAPGAQPFDDRHVERPNMGQPNRRKEGGNRPPADRRPGKDEAKEKEPLTDDDIELAMARGLDPKVASQFKPTSGSISRIVIDGRFVFMLESAKVVQAFDWKTREVVGQAKANNEVTAMSVSRDQKGNSVLWLGTSSGSFESWRLEDGAFLKTGEHKSGVGPVTMVSAISSAETQMAVVAGGSKIRRLWLDDNWDRKIEEIPKDLFGNQILAIRLSPDGSRIFASDGVKWASLDAEKGSGDDAGDVAFKNVRSLSFSPDCKNAVATNGKEIALISTSDWSVVRKFPLPLADKVYFATNDSVLVLKQGFVEHYATGDFRLVDKYWATGTGLLAGMSATESHLFAIDRTLGEIGYVFELANVKRAPARGAGKKSGRAGGPIAGTPDLNRIPVDGNVNELPPREVKPIPHPRNVPYLVGQSPGISPGMRKMAFDSKNQLVLITSDGSLLFADWQNRKWLNKEVKSACEGTTTCVKISPDNKSMVVAADTGRVSVWDLSDDKPKVKFRFDGHAKGVTKIEFTEDSSNVVTADKGGRVICWELESGKQLNVFDEFSGPVISVSIHQQSVTATDGKKILRGRIDSGNGKYVKINDGNTKVWVSTSGGKIAVLNNRRISIYDRSSIKLLETLKPDGVVSDLVFSSDDRTIFLRSSKHVSQWDWKAGRRVAQYDASPTKIVVDFVVSADGQNLAIIESKGSSIDSRVFEVQ